MSEKHRCWVTEGYGCPYKIGNRYWDTYKCPYRGKDSPCEKKDTVEIQTLSGHRYLISENHAKQLKENGRLDGPAETNLGFTVKGNQTK